MEYIPELSPSDSPSESTENTCDIAEESAGGELFEIGQRFLFSDSSISLSAEDLTSMEEEDTTDEYKASTSDSEHRANGKSYMQWHGFLRKLKKGSTMHLHPFHPNLPHFRLIKKQLKRRRNAQSLSVLPPLIDSELIDCFKSLWKNFSLSALQVATDNFSHENLIGEGGYSEVYRGRLEDGELVAIKRLIRETPTNKAEDYLSELGILVHVDHPNIANVIGYGIEGGMHLILPLSLNGSLSSVLSGQKEKLAWCFRYRIALGVASGISYLHEGCQRRIIHRDIKSDNVLLTEDFEPKITDFGLAKWLPDQWTQLTVSELEGTLGYLPPEFFMHGMVDEKTDVYAFGVLLLELITGRPAIDDSHQSLVMWAKPMLISKNYAELVDPSLCDAYDSEQMNRMVMVASICIHQSSTERPQMSQVLRMLKGNECIQPINKKFQKRPALRRTYPVEFIEEEECTA
ncbi:Protein kinase superfamily protein [Forsythia ovata]|uniref:non-specific serine/threonine protein kinase n=1 Tax=Forsythia ovata TaxID=205694 RepID=A0ABD1UZD4_9LAMI